MLKLSFKLFLLVIFGLVLSCRNDDPVDEFFIEDINANLVLVNGNYQDVELDEEPEFRDGGMEGFINAFYDVINYPAIARENGTMGTVILEYNILETGYVENITIQEDPGDGLGEEARSTLELITEGQSFHPAILNGEPVSVKKRIPVKFKLQ